MALICGHVLKMGVNDGGKGSCQCVTTKEQGLRLRCNDKVSQRANDNDNAITCDRVSL